jgi:hypothetical protein
LNKFLRPATTHTTNSIHAFSGYRLGFNGRTTYEFINDPKNRPTKDLNPTGADRLPQASPNVDQINITPSN